MPRKGCENVSFNQFEIFTIIKVKLTEKKTKPYFLYVQKLDAL